MRTVIAIVGASLFVLAIGPAATPAAAAEKDPVFTTRGNLAIRGYDPVAYFTDEKAVKGQPRLQPRLAGRDLALRQRREPRPLRRGAYKVRAPVRRLLRLGCEPQLHRAHRP